MPTPEINACASVKSESKANLVESLSRPGYLKTIALPMGASEIPASLRCCKANGMPMIVIPNNTAQAK